MNYSININKISIKAILAVVFLFVPVFVNAQYSYDSYSPSYSYDSYTPSYSYDSYTPSYSYDSYTPSYSYDSYTPYYSYTPSYSYDSYTPSYSYNPSYEYTSEYAYNYTPGYSTYVYGGGNIYNHPPNNNREDLRVECIVSDTTVRVGDKVTFLADAFGGNNPYEYDWNGDVNSSSRTVEKTFTRAGRYTASVNVTDDDGDQDSDDCATVVVEEDNNNDNLQVQCEISDTSVKDGDDVTVDVNIDGGKSPYKIKWTGDTDEFSSFDDKDDSQKVRVDTNSDLIELKVTVTDDKGNKESDDCTIRVDQKNNNNDDLQVQCKISDTTADDRDYVTVSVDIKDGNSPYKIKWTGDTDEFDSFDKSDDSQKVRIDTNQSRIELEITVTDDDGNKESDDCTIKIDDNNDNNDKDVRVITSRNNDGDLAGLSSVFLSQVPYTGSEDILKTIGFIAGLLIWASIIATVLLRKRNKKEVSSKAMLFKEANKLKKVSN